MSKEFKFHPFDLQLFAEGAAGDGGTGTDGGNGVSAGDPSLQTRGVKNPLADVQYGKQDVHPTDVRSNGDGVDRAAEFERLIKTEYKDLYDARVSDIVQKRLKSTKETVDKYTALTPTLEMLSRKYGVDASDIDALNRAIEEDDTYYEDEALEKGITVEQLKEIRKMERENAELKAQMRDQQVRENADRIYAGWMEQAQSLQAIYPSFDLNVEIQNPRFTDLLRNNVDVRTAYEVLHKDEIIPAAMQFTAQTVEAKIANKIRSQGARPAEVGMGSQASAVVKSDVSQLSKADRQEIARRVARGEKIRF